MSETGRVSSAAVRIAEDYHLGHTQPSWTDISVVVEHVLNGHVPMGINARGDAQCAGGCGDWPCPLIAPASPPSPGVEP